jgi:hypothetical protein
LAACLYGPKSTFWHHTNSTEKHLNNHGYSGQALFLFTSRSPRQREGEHDKPWRPGFLPIPRISDARREPFRETLSRWRHWLAATSQGGFEVLAGASPAVHPRADRTAASATSWPPPRPRVRRRHLEARVPATWPRSRPPAPRPARRRPGPARRRPPAPPGQGFLCAAGRAAAFACAVARRRPREKKTHTTGRGRGRVRWTASRRWCAVNSDARSGRAGNRYSSPLVFKLKQYRGRSVIDNLQYRYVEGTNEALSLFSELMWSCWCTDLTDRRFSRATEFSFTFLLTIF